MEELDLENRQLCRDGACIGVIGADGRCKVCGQAGVPGVAEAETDSEAESESEAEAEMEAEAETDSESDVEPDSDGAFSERQLCPDGACIGVIGPDGRCKVCGRTGS